MDFRILGQTEVLDGARRLELPGGRGRALLGLLLLHAGEPVAAERIVDELWGDDPRKREGARDEPFAEPEQRRERDEHEREPVERRHGGAG